MTATWRWRKHGLLFNVSKQGTSWMHSHAQAPVADHLGGDFYQIYFASRDHGGVSSIGSVVVELGNSPKLIDIDDAPVLFPGPIGSFDEHGVYPSSVVSIGDRKRMYFIGWNRGYRSPLFYSAIGLAESVDGGQTWIKVLRAPLMSRSEHDPCLVTSPHVMWHGGRFRMTYVSGVRWEEIDGVLQSYYHIKYAESDDGLVWQRDGAVAIDFHDRDETNIARSAVIEEGGRLKMLFSYVRRGASYRMGYAESEDWKHWKRNDAVAGFDVTPRGFDSDMTCYPHLVQHDGRLFMFYNGNRFGADGFGLAERIEF